MKKETELVHVHIYAILEFTTMQIKFVSTNKKTLQDLLANMNRNHVNGTLILIDKLVAFEV